MNLSRVQHDRALRNGVVLGLLSGVLFSGCSDDGPVEKANVGGDAGSGKGGSGGQAGSGGSSGSGNAAEGGMDSGGEGPGSAGSSGSAGSGGKGGSGGTGGSAGELGDGGEPPLGCENCNDDCSNADVAGSDWVAGCFDGTGMAQQGPAQGEDLSLLCAELVTCALETKCYDIGGATFDVGNCYCGTGNCQAGDGNGLCRDEVEAGAESTEYASVSGRYYDPAYAIGRAFLLLDCYAYSCAETAECLPLTP